jgi:hypothetical protein
MRERTWRSGNSWLLLSLAVLISGSTVMGQDPSTNHWFGKDGTLNGRFWEDAKDSQKLAYLAGFLDGVLWGSVELLSGQGDSLENQKAAKGVRDAYLATGFLLSDYMKELNTLYADRENIRIPIGVAVRYCAVKLGGTQTKAKLEQLLITYRKNSSASEETQP